MKSISAARRIALGLIVATVAGCVSQTKNSQTIHASAPPPVSRELVKGNTLQNVTEISCDQAAGQHSIFDASSKQTFVTAENATSVAVQLLWIDYSGQRQLYKVIQPAGTFAVNTWNTHPWVITDAAGGCIVAFMPGTDSGRITLR